ncbi:MAG: tetratricopeptide repeat protein [Treponema sp.]|jgi:tetratricopeptide (TPR) repeat protein|nr:tetratricopeptide repeat protein [Treponema sp.]
MKYTVVFLFFMWMPILGGAQTRIDALNEYRNGNFERSVALSEILLKEDPQNIEAHVVICWSLIQLARYPEAARYAQRARALNRYDARIIEIQGEIDYYEGRNAEALLHFQEYVNVAPEGHLIDTVYYFMGELYIRQGKFRHADIALSLAVHWQQENALWHTRLGYAREKAGELTEAIQSYNRALELNARLVDAQRGLERSRQAFR